MAWGARQEDGIWRICERRGRTIVHACSSLLPDVEIRFPARSRAEECAHQLNELHWSEYEQHRKRNKTTRETPCAWEMLAIIRDNEGISSEDYNRLIEARKEQQ